MYISQSVENEGDNPLSAYLVWLRNVQHDRILLRYRTYPIALNLQVQYRLPSHWPPIIQIFPVRRLYLA